MKILAMLLALFASFGVKAQSYNGCDTQTCATTTPAHSLILVHGLDGSPSNFGTLTTYLTARGWTENTNLFRFDATSYCGDNDFCTELVGYADGGSVFETYAECLADYIDEKVPCVNGVCPTVDLVGHSAGGLLVRYYQKFLSNRDVDTLITVASPNQGTTNACPASCAGRSEMCDDSQFLLDLNGETDLTYDETPGSSTNGPTHFGTVLSEADVVIQPYCTGMLITNPQSYDASNLTCSDPTVFTNATRDLSDDTAQCWIYNGSLFGTGHTSMLSLSNVHKHICNNIRQGD